MTSETHFNPRKRFIDIFALTDVRKIATVVTRMAIMNTRVGTLIVATLL
jgi:hypothetical protein